MAATPAGKRAARTVTYKAELRRLQIALVRAHRHIITNGQRVLVIFEGRDGSGKDGAIKRIVEHLSPRETRVVALGKPSDLLRVIARPLWERHYRVNVFVGENAATAKIANSYFVEVDSDDRLFKSTPRITKQY